MKEESGKEANIKVRGISLISTSKYMKSRMSAAEWEEFLHSIPLHLREILSDINKSSWYPFGAQRVMREEIVKRFNPDNPRQAILDAYMHATDYEISTFLRGMFSFLPVKLVVGRAAALWGKYYQPSRMRAVSTGEKQIALELADFPSDELFCPAMEAWLATAAKYQRLKNFRIAETRCIHRGDDVCRWEARWE